MYWKNEDIYEYFKEYNHSQNKNHVPKDVAAIAKVALGEKCVNEIQTYEEIRQNLQSLPNSLSTQHPVEEVQVCI